MKKSLKTFIKPKTLTSVIVLMFALLSVMCEVFLQMKGAIDFPIYNVEPNGHYFLKKDQRGNFLNKNQWFVNSSGFNNESEIRMDKPFTLLIGDSVIYGGNPVDYYQRVGYQLEQLTKRPVYVGALGGWSLYNELEFLNHNAKMVQSADQIIIQYDNGDLAGFALADPNDNPTHPSQRPILATYYYFQKYILPKISKTIYQSELPPIPTTVKNTEEWKSQLLELSKKTKNKIIFVLYPDKAAFENAVLWNKQTQDIKEFINAHAEKFDYIDVAQSALWNSNLYRDGIHPSEKGNSVLAALISDYCKQTSSYLTTGSEPSNAAVQKKVSFP